MAKRTSPGLSSGRLNLFGEKIATLRKERGWSQLQFLLRLQKKGWDIRPSALGRIETGERSITDAELVFLLKVLGHSLEVLPRKSP